MLAFCFGLTSITFLDLPPGLTVVFYKIAIITRNTIYVNVQPMGIYRSTHTLTHILIDIECQF